MKKLLLLAALSLAGCYNEPVSKATSDNSSVELSVLFSHDGCNVYRFWDGGRYHYYADCRGSTVSPQGCGKACIRDENIQTISASAQETGR